MARIKSKKYTGIYLNHLKNGDVTYYVTYKNEFGKKVFHKIGKKSDGITEIIANVKRNEFVNKVNLGIDPAAHKKKKNIITLNQLAKIYFDDKRCMICDNCKAYKIHTVIFLFGLSPSDTSIPLKDLLETLFQRLCTLLLNIRRLIEIDLHS